MKKIRIGYIGAGQWGLIKHLPSLRHIANNYSGNVIPELVHLVEANPAHRRKVQSDWGFKRSSPSISGLLEDTKLNAYVITINPAKLGEVIPALAATGKPIFCEKPPGENSSEATEFSRLVSQTSLIAFNRRFQPLVQQLQALIKTEEIHCFQAHILRHGRLDSFNSRKDRITPPFFKATGIHLIDTLRFLLGDLCVDNVRCMETIPGINDGRMVDLHTQNGKAHGQVAFLPTCGRNEEMIEFHTTERSFQLKIHLNRDEESSLRIYHKGKCERTYLDDPNRGELWNHGYIPEHLEFIEAIANGTQTISNFQNVTNSLEVAEAIEAREVSL